MVDVFGNNIVGAYTGGVSVKAIYTNGVKVWPVVSYYIRWTPSDLSGTFSMNGQTYNLQDYSGYFTDFNGEITSDAFKNTGIETLETNAIKINNGLYGAFYNCSSLRTINLISCSYIGRLAFRSCYSISEISLPVCEYIGELAFASCSLSQVSLPACTSLGNGTFENNSLLSQISLPVCRYIGDVAFADCVSLTSISLPVCEYIGELAFVGCSLSQVSLPACTSLGTGVFENNSLLSQISLPACRYIRDVAFANCTSLSQISLPVCSYIDSNTFLSAALKKITLGSNTVCTMNYHTFYGTPIESGSGSIYVPASLVNAYKAASGWSSLSNYIFPIQ